MAKKGDRDVKENDWPAGSGLGGRMRESDIGRSLRARRRIMFFMVNLLSCWKHCNVQEFFFSIIPPNYLLRSALVLANLQDENIITQLCFARDLKFFGEIDNYREISSHVRT